MVLTEERATKLSNYLLSDVDRAKKLADYPAEEALAMINADGNDFTIDEIKEFGKIMEHVSTTKAEDGELDDSALEEVAGGIVITAGLLAAGVALFTAGVTFGYKVARDRGW